MKVKVTKRKNGEELAEAITVEILVEFLNEKYIKQGNGNAKIRVNLPGKGWVYTPDVSDVFGEPYIGLPLETAEEITLAAEKETVVEKEITVEKPQTKEKESK